MLHIAARRAAGLGSTACCCCCAAGPLLLHQHQLGDKALQVRHLQQAREARGRGGHRAGSSTTRQPVAAGLHGPPGIAPPHTGGLRAARADEQRAAHGPDGPAGLYRCAAGCLPANLHACLAVLPACLAAWLGCLPGLAARPACRACLPASPSAGGRRCAAPAPAAAPGTPCPLRYRRTAPCIAGRAEWAQEGCRQGGRLSGGGREPCRNMQPSRPPARLPASPTHSSASRKSSLPARVAPLPSLSTGTLQILWGAPVGRHLPRLGAQ